MAWTDIPNADIDAESPLDADLFTAIRDNLNFLKLPIYNFTDTSDTSISTVTPTGTLWSASQNITIPTKGLIFTIPHLRVDNASGGNKIYSVGLRINGTDYFANYDDNGTLTYATTDIVATAQYLVLKGGISYNISPTPALDIAALGISTGAQTVQPVIGTNNSTATQTLKGTTVTARLKMYILEAA